MTSDFSSLEEEEIMKRMKSLPFGGAALAVLLAIPGPVFADDKPKSQEQSSQMSEEEYGTGGSGQAQQPMGERRMLDVEELRDNISMYQDRNVTVAGEVKDKLDARSFVLESGGIFDDEIVVITSPQTKGPRLRALSDDADLIVSGKVRSVSIVDLEEELSWDLDPQIVAELEGQRHFLVADRISYQKR